ncbi:unnamed protein product [Cuscuta epithymum]|uniref:Poly [ADP-ribose] polymerase n=1 Tax=Cuscuta epithymum TaxID=186058 RepID=A0AAV0DK01_9ASTE|nr:unnamed protein product [Cuscuta epithymum]
METKFGPVLDNNRQISVNLKRKCGVQPEKYTNVTNHMYIPNACPPSYGIHRFIKQRKLSGIKSKSGYGSPRKSLLQHYLNFKKSGPPKRLMYYQNGEWIDFPESILPSVKEDLHIEKSIIEVEFSGKICVLDFVSMMLVDLKTGIQQSIAWIDEAGNCFFPEIFADGIEGDAECNNTAYENNEINLQIEIEINRSNFSEPEESCGESNAYVKLVKVDLDPEAEDSDMENGDYDKGLSAAKGNGSSAENVHSEEKTLMLGPARAFLDSDSVRKMFITGIEQSAHTSIINVARGSSTFMEARLELFQKQAEIVKKLRGHANVQFAWFPSTKSAFSSIMNYGLANFDSTNKNSQYGLGVHLVPINHTEISANFCDVDENGVRHMILCRVIMGNMEPVSLGSKQFHPSNESFDNGVDDLQYPKHYIVWSMNMNTHIYPEYVVSFKFEAEGAVVQSENLNNSGVSTCYEGSPNQVYSSMTRLITMPDASILQNQQGNVPRIPKSPWMSFPDLFAAISEKVAAEKMKVINSSYELFKSKKINRDELVRKLRLCVGDTILRSTIMSLQGKAPKSVELATHPNLEP